MLPKMSFTMTKNQCMLRNVKWPGDIKNMKLNSPEMLNSVTNRCEADDDDRLSTLKINDTNEEAGRESGNRSSCHGYDDAGDQIRRTKRKLSIVCSIAINVVVIAINVVVNVGVAGVACWLSNMICHLALDRGSNCSKNEVGARWSHLYYLQNQNSLKPNTKLSKILATLSRYDSVHLK